MSIKLSKKYRLMSVLLLLMGIFLLNSVKCQNNNNNNNNNNVMPNDEEDDFADDYNASGFNENNDGLSKEDEQYGGNMDKPMNSGPVGVNTYKDTANNRVVTDTRVNQAETFNEDDDGADDLNGDDNMDADSDDDYSQNDLSDNTSDPDQSIVKPNDVDSSSSSNANNNNNNNISNQPPIFTFQSSRSKLLHIITKPGILAGIVGGAVIGILTAILLIMFIVYRMRKKDEGSYALEETKKPLNAYDYRHCPTKEFYA